MKRKPGKAGAPEASAVPADLLRYATGYHAPVLWKATVEGLVTDRSGTYIDGTLGGGGHTAALLDVLERGGRVFGVDQDPDALTWAGQRLASFVETGRLVLLRGNFGDVANLVREAGVQRIDGLLLDLGVSSHQIDAPERGFSYMAEGRLDMRMDPEGALTAHDVINSWTEAELKRLFFEYGEEPASGRIVRAIVQARPIETTSELAGIVRRSVKPPDAVKTLSRVFQAIRIAVNAELDVLERALGAATDLVSPGGRLAVIAYHSLEDRRVKRYMRSGNFEGEVARDVYGNQITPWRELTRKPIEADENKIAANPRSRSARLRIAVRQGDVE